MYQDNYFKLKVITIDKIPVYHVVNTRDNVSESNSLSYDIAIKRMRELNQAERAKTRLKVRVA